SATVRDSLERDLGIDPERVTVIPNGVRMPPPAAKRTPAELRRELGLEPESRLLVFVGRLVPNKNQRALIAMMPSVLERVPRARLVLVGEGPFEAELRREIASRGLEHAVVLAGRYPDVPAVLGAAELFVTASVTEGISLAVLEAMAAGVAVAGLRSEGNEEVLAGDAGLLVDGDDPARLGVAVADLLEDPGRRTALAAAGTARVRERYAFEGMVARMIDVYRDLASAATTPDPRNIP
ncbi:glycosyltransferase, partial [bacterium]|nr:glycosyltransferase [bacterium]